MSRAEVPGLIQSVFETLDALARNELPAEPVALTPAVPIKRSVTDE